MKMSLDEETKGIAEPETNEFGIRAHRSICHYSNAVRGVIDVKLGAKGNYHLVPTANKIYKHQMENTDGSASSMWSEFQTPGIKECRSLS